MNRIQATFDACKQQQKAAQISYIMASDPNHDTSLKLMHALSNNGADILEVGMPFSDPMADGPVIQKAAQRALKSDGSLKNTLKIVKQFREKNNTTPIILMGYYNPIFHHGVEAFVNDAISNGVDGVIIVDLPPEEELEFVKFAEPAGLNLIRLTAPTTTQDRAKTILKHASGFVYYISVAGITGGKSGTESEIMEQIALLRKETDLPIAIGFGIKTPEQAASMGDLADGVVIGSAIVNLISDYGNEESKCLEQVTHFISSIDRALKHPNNRATA